MTTSQLGRTALEYYYSQARALNRDLPPSFDQFMQLLRRTYYPKSVVDAPQGYPASVFYPKTSDEQAREYIYDQLGTSIELAELSESRWKNALSRLAQAGSGGIPATRNDFANAVKNEAMDMNIYSFFDMAAYVTKESAAQVASGVKAVGEAVIDTGKTLLGYRNYLLFAALALVGLAAYRRIAGRGFSSNPRRRLPSRKELIREHKKLIPTLKYGSKKARLKEARHQEKELRSLMKNPKRWKRSSRVSSLLFSKDFFSESQARAWAANHGFKFGSVHETKNYFRLRQIEPGVMADFRTIEFTPGIRAIVGPVKG